MNKPLVSIIVPTHERSAYAVPTINGLLSLPGHVEVVVCDTSETDSISSALANHPNVSALKLVRPNQKLSVVDNFNTALKAASGRYLTFIGDDDLVSSRIVSVAEWAEKNAVDSIKFNFPALYYWPDFLHATTGKSLAGTLAVTSFDGSVVRHDAKSAAYAALRDFGGGVKDMPRAYAGLISRNLVNSIEGKYGQLFGGVSPDIYSAFLISQEAQKCFKIDFPVIIPGASGASTTGQSASGHHVGLLRANAHIRPFHNLVWDDRIPEFYSVPTVWAFSLLKAVERHGKSPLSVNFPSLYVRCFLRHRGYFKFINASLKTHLQGRGYISTVAALMQAFLKEIFYLLTKRITKFRYTRSSANEKEVHAQLQDTVEASICFENLYSNRQIAFRDL